MMNHTIAPLYAALCAYERNRHISLHVPGHKDGNVFDKEADNHFYSILKIDATEVSGLDDLHHPAEVIAEAQEMAADAFGAAETFFLIGGSTAGNLAAALTLCAPGDTILVQRNAHKSIFNGLLLAGARPVFITPYTEPDTQVATGISATHVKVALKKYPSAKAVWITNPNYYGMGQNVAEIAEACHQAGIPLIVDEAHGAHFSQALNVPDSALKAGADLVVQSTHKMLPAMTMASMLHIQGTRIPREKLKRVLSMIQSSSPSYPLMASLDVARRYLVTKGRKQLVATVEKLEQARLDLTRKLEYLFIWSEIDGKTVYTRDPLKWVLTSRHFNVTGYQLLEWLEEMGIVAEMADLRNVVLVFPIHNEVTQIEKVINAVLQLEKKLANMPGERRTRNRTNAFFTRPGRLVEPSISLQEAFHFHKKRVPLEQAIGWCSAEMVIPYPPGVPLLVPGEKITEEHVNIIQEIKWAGGYFQGTSDETVEGIFVLVSL
ncbi:aminotransferase class I/II-fold pyridoxal phosphate-dependent enzyme [Aneurinibacillus thermoaerophilus]|uniref:aminotransferase class I/II-fold pyridoxal phosphate-dependent enzyme n=1 Tax=Aneurinibacillus thermoaerophilus TaxID=143495 RepID=UPI002E231F25|nr:aminotransferase class I/II-fold pyridoxal phosphate-dependent enzyme [Aneurinibacillus thermoaerophilus]MED0675167.1 aminotransferase class I/II-fold pyridoxal phosphate-dependent enzyme [Aneurinibacillus thermoaerophilus]